MFSFKILIFQLFLNECLLSQNLSLTLTSLTADFKNYQLAAVSQNAFWAYFSNYIWIIWVSLNLKPSSSRRMIIFIHQLIKQYFWHKKPNYLDITEWVYFPSILFWHISQKVTQFHTNIAEDNFCLCLLLLYYEILSRSFAWKKFWLVDSINSKIVPKEQMCSSCNFSNLKKM